MSCSLSLGVENGPRRNLEPYLQSRVVDQTAQLSWKQGPRTGEAYDSIELANCDFSATPTIEQLETYIVERFVAHGAENIELPAFTKAEHTRISLAVGEAITALYLAYYGSPSSNNGIELAQLFDLEGKGEAYSTFANNIITHGRRAYLGELGLRHGIKGLQIPYGDSYTGIRHVRRDCFIGDGDFQEYAGMALTHSTVTDVTPTAIQLGAITCSNTRMAAGLSKVSGETKRGRASGAEYVFFWPTDTITRTEPSSRAFDPHAGLELPAVWGIKDVAPMEMAGIKIDDGRWMNEKIVEGEIPLEFFTNLWVPPIVVARQTRLLTAHGYGHIAVSPLPANSSYF